MKRKTQKKKPSDSKLSPSPCRAAITVMQEKHRSVWERRHALTSTPGLRHNLRFKPILIQKSLIIVYAAALLNSLGSGGGRGGGGGAGNGGCWLRPDITAPWFWTINWLHTLTSQWGLLAALVLHHLLQGLRLTLFKCPQQPLFIFSSMLPFNFDRPPLTHTHTHWYTVTHRFAGLWPFGISCWTRTKPSVRPPAAAGSGSSASGTNGPSPCCSPASSAECRCCPDLPQTERREGKLQLCVVPRSQRDLQIKFWKHK